MAYSIFSAQIPDIMDADSPDPALTLGTQWYSEADGAVKAIRFYLGNRLYDNQQITVGLFEWTDSPPGTLLAQQTYTVTSANAIGFVEVLFSSPVMVARNQAYVAAVLFPGAGITADNKAHYVYSTGFFANAVDNPPLHAYRNDTIFNHKLNGVYVVGSNLTYPTNSSGSNCYFIDVVFDYITKAKVRTSGGWSSHPVKVRTNNTWQV